MAGSSPEPKNILLSNLSSERYGDETTRLSKDPVKKLLLAKTKVINGPCRSWIGKDPVNMLSLTENAMREYQFTSVEGNSPVN